MLCVIWNRMRGFKKKSMLRVFQVGGMGGTAAQIWVFFLNEPSLTINILLYIAILEL